MSSASLAREPDVVVALGSIPADWLVEPVSRAAASGDDAEDVGDSWSQRRAETGETLCVFAGVGRYLVREGRSIVVEPDPSADFDVVRHLLLGPVLAQLLWQRDVFTLHASVVGFPVVDGHSYSAFVGVSGEGKSTTAAALEASGHPLVCDDVAALVRREDAFYVLPAFPRIRLYADSVESVGDDPARHPLVHSLIDKRSKSVTRFMAEPILLDRLYVLATGNQFSIDPLAPREAVIEMLRHTYYAHQYAPLYGFKQHLEHAARVAERVATFRLTRPKDLARLPELVGLLDAHALSHRTRA
jgi:hypothetical protein